MTPSGRSSSKTLPTGKIPHPVIQLAFYWALGWVRGDGGEDPGRRHGTEMTKLGNQSKVTWKAKGVGLCRRGFMTIKKGE